MSVYGMDGVRYCYYLIRASRKNQKERSIFLNYRPYLIVKI